MTYETIIYQPGTIARVILNRPHTYNAQDRLMLNELDDAFAAAAADGDVRVVVLSGAGPHFSSGHDVKEIAEAAPETPHERYTRMSRTYIDAHLRWRNLAKPTIAMVHGYCIFGGWMLASTMDVIFAADDALFLALPNPGDYWAVGWDLGPRKALEILYENRFLTAEEARAAGFVNRVYPRARLEAETMAYAERVAENDPSATLNAKHVIRQMLDGMGFTPSVVAAFHGTRMMGGLPRPAGTAGVVQEEDGKRRFRGVKQALERLEADRKGRAEHA